MSRFPDSTLTFPQAQQAVRHIAGEPRDLDHRVARLADAIDPHPTQTQPTAHRGTAHLLGCQG